jgi:hypothetical protein
VRVLNLPFWLNGRVPFGVTNPVLVWISEQRATLMELFLGAGPLFFGGVLLLIGMVRLRYAWVAFLLLMACTAYPFLEFQGRHIFQFEFLVLAMIALGCSLAWRELLGLPQPGVARETTRRAARSAATLAGLFAMAVATVAVARGVQVPRARALLTSYTTAPVVPVPTTELPLAAGQVRLAADVFGAPPAARDSIQAAMIVADFDRTRCTPPSSIVAIFRYVEAEPRFALNFSREVTLSFAPGLVDTTRAFLPVYSLRRDGKLMSRFVGLDVPAQVAPCVRLGRVQDDALPLLLPATLAPAWQDERLYQRLHFDAMMPPFLWLKIFGRWPGMAELG